MTPIAVFTYNRPEHTQRALRALAACRRLSECRVHVYCDGAKTPPQAAAVDASRRVVRDWAAQHAALVVERPQNLGLARSIAGGVSELCAQYGRVIVVEDDLVVSPDFIDYMVQALDRYAEAEQVYQISGYMFPVEHPLVPDAFFLPLTTTWGWATWQRAWQHFDWNAPGARQQLADREFRRRFDLDDSYPYAAMLEQRLAGQTDSWGILWWYTVFTTGALVLHPRQSLVWNGGFDGSGTHCADDAMESAPETVACPRLWTSLKWPGEVAVDAGALARILVHLNAARRPSAWSRLRRHARLLRRSVS